MMNASIITVEFRGSWTGYLSLFRSFSKISWKSLILGEGVEYHFLLFLENYLKTNIIENKLNIKSKWRAHILKHKLFLNDKIKLD